MGWLGERDRERTRVGCGAGCDCAPCAHVAGKVAPVVGADSGASWASVDAAVRRLDATLTAQGKAPAEWHAFAEDWAARRKTGRPWSPAEVTKWAERLAQVAERVGGAMSMQRVAGCDGRPGRGTDGVSLALAEVGTRGIASNSPREARQADDALSALWGAVRPFVPYGDVIDQVHQARRRLMWGEGEPDPTVRELQDLTRRARKGDARSRATLAALKAQAVRDPNARRRWAAAVAVMADDQTRIDALTDGTAGSPSAPNAPAASQGGLGGMLGGLGGMLGGLGR